MQRVHRSLPDAESICEDVSFEPSHEHALSNCAESLETQAPEGDWGPL